MATFGVIVFPGSNCDHDAYHAMKNVLGCKTKFLWHKDTDLSGIDFLIVPGGFSYGDYLRSGAIARFSPIMQEVIKSANNGLPVMGICNGFQILLEAGLIPGAMMHNHKLDLFAKVSPYDVKLLTLYSLVVLKPTSSLIYPFLMGKEITLSINMVYNHYKIMIK